MNVHHVAGNIRIGVDVGGTFTDLILYDGDTGRVSVAKEPTTPAAPEIGVAAAIRSSVPPEQIRAADYLLHGTTVGLNALLERRGAKVGLLTTRGFRDILEIRRGDRDEPYNLFWKQPPPLVPRRLRLPVTERIRADGAIHVPLDPDDIKRALRAFETEGVECIAIVYINAYANPQHELETEQVLRALGFNGPISLSHLVSGEYREYERTCTTVLDAYVRPRMSAYLKHLETDLRDNNFQGSLLITRSGGGAMTFPEAEARPFETILSGPVAGAEGAAELAQTLGLSSVITADVGGTSFDTCLISDGRAQVMYRGHVIGLPVQSEWVDVRSIGAGGGSVAYIDVGGLLRVGPRSAGADPGPACYGKGGSEPTVTDAALVLGMLGPARLASGIQLDIELAHTALVSLAHILAMSVEEVARGILTIATAGMANAIREITVEQGQDPRVASLMPFGGAGPLFATLLARELEIANFVIPPHAGNFSAWALLSADLTRTAARTRILHLSVGALDTCNGILPELFDELASRREDGDTTRHSRTVGLDMRYVGQEHSLTVSVASKDGQIIWGPDEAHSAFVQDYRRTFGHEIEEDVEIVAVRAALRTPLPKMSERLARRPVTNRLQNPPAMMEVFSFVEGTWVPFRLVERDSIEAQSTVMGPAIIVEETATTYLDSGFAATVDTSGSLIVNGVL
ncbi:MAG: hydantoinase/oxoprolinase family protein [Chloroflexota bacterium]|nr:hydantoinase/oxoprolinase family protein [Chloroflexota bacterium]